MEDLHIELERHEQIIKNIEKDLTDNLVTEYFELLLVFTSVFETTISFSEQAFFLNSALKRKGIFLFR